MKKKSLSEELKTNEYPGRGIVLGRSADKKSAVIVYFIMGRSANSRNRIFVSDGDGIRTEAFDPSKMEDPSLIIYSPVRVFNDETIVTNGDQTDTIYGGRVLGKTFEESLRSRKFEPDAPNYTPRISGVVELKKSGIVKNDFSYQMSILKSHNGDAACRERHTYSYDNPIAGEGHFIHTYMSDGEPLPSYEGEPTLVDIAGDIDALTASVWESLNEANKVSLFVRYINIETGEYDTRIVNKNK